MSSAPRDNPADAEHIDICRFCGFIIRDDEQQCAALDDGVCQP